jgi:hypothetical protein
MVPQQDKDGNILAGGKGVGLMAEDVQTIAPVGLLGGAVTITVLGPWHLRAVAGGVPGSAFIDYGPASPNATTPVVTIQGSGGTTLASITAQQLFGPGGFSVNLPGIATITIGTPAHAIGGSPTSAVVESADGTTASAAADILHVNLSLSGLTIADLRLGHMEAAATVPAGGVLCQVDVSKRAQPSNVNPGDEFTYIIDVHNPHGCVLTGVRVVDTITTTGGVRYSILGQNPKADSVVGGTLTWNDIGPINPGDTKELTVQMKVSPNSAGGTFTQTANVTASCAIGNASGSSTISVPAAGGVTIQLPTISGGKRPIPVTGGLTGRYYAAALVIALAALALGRRGFKALFESK